MKESSSLSGTGSGKEGVLSCGRVQTPTLALIVRREQAIERFVPKPYFVLSAVFAVRDRQLPMSWEPAKTLLEQPGVADSEGRIIKKDVVEAVAQKIRGQTGHVTEVQTSTKKEKSPLLYSLGSLQREANKRYGIKAQAVLGACQALYEQFKATTYPRTDCEYLPVSMFGEACEVLSALKTVDQDLTPLITQTDPQSMPRSFNDKKITAHHAIVPTTNTKVNLNGMSATERRIYDLIRLRYIAQFLGDYVYSETVIRVCCIQEAFIAKGIVPLEPGWKRAYEKLDAQKTNSEQKSTEAPTMIVPDVKKDDQALNTEAQVKSKKTTPPKRYTEGTLLGAMENIAREIEDPRLQTVMKNKEKAGIGTDATRAEVIETLLRRHYIALEKKELKPTAKGTELITLVEKIDPMIADPVLTAMWEDQLSAIEQGGLSLGDFEAAIGQWLTLRIQTIKDKAPARIANPARLQQSNYACPQCAAQKQTSILSLFSKGLKCTKCNFILWTEVSGYTLQDSEITILLQGKTTPPLSLTSRQGKPYQASLRIGSQWKIEQLFQFP